MNRLFASLIDPKIVSVIRLFILHPTDLYHLQKISQQTKVPLGSTFRIVRKLVKLEVLSITTVGKMKLYKLNQEEKIATLRKILA